MSYVPGAIADIAAATDTSFAALVAAHTMTWNAGTQQWNNAAPAAPAAINDIGNVTGTPSTDDVLTFGGATWGPEAPAGGAGVGAEVSALVRAAAGISIANNTDVGLTGFASVVDFNHGTMFSAGAPDRLTVPAGEGGRYVVFAWMSYPSGSGHRDLKVKVNGSNQRWFRMWISGTNSTYVPASFAALDLAAADYVTLVARQNSGGTLVTNDQTLFSMFKVGAGDLTSSSVTLDYFGTNVSNGRYLDCAEDSEDLADSMRTGSCVPFACRLAYSAIKIDSFGGDETIEILEGASVKTTITVAADDQATDHTGSSITFAAGTNLRVKAATNFAASEDIHVKLVLEKT